MPEAEATGDEHVLGVPAKGQLPDPVARRVWAPTIFVLVVAASVRLQGSPRMSALARMPRTAPVRTMPRRVFSIALTSSRPNDRCGPRKWPIG